MGCSPQESSVESEMVQNGPKLCSLQSTLKILEHLLIHCPFIITIWSLTVWNINGSFLPSDLMKCIIFPSKSEGPKGRINAISLPCLLLYSLTICGGFKTKLLLYVTSMYQRRPLKKLNKTYFDHIVALSALKSPVATKWLPPPPNWVKINFDVAIPHSSTVHNCCYL